MIGTVYKIEIGEGIYVGSTIQKLCKRQNTHNDRLKQEEYKNKLYEECRINNIENIVCIPLEVKEIENELEIRQLEQEYITKLQPSLNSNLAYTGLTREEYIKEYKKQYNEDNKETLKEKNKEYNKEYYKNNRDKRKEYYENNKKKLLEKLGEKIMCPICNTILNISSLLSHQKTKKCLSYNRHTASIK